MWAGYWKMSRISTGRNVGECIQGRGNEVFKDTEVAKGSHFQATMRPVWTDQTAQVQEEWKTHLEGREDMMGDTRVMLGHL